MVSLSTLPAELQQELIASAERLSGSMSLRDAARAACIQALEMRRLALADAYSKGLTGHAVCVAILTQITLLQLAQESFIKGHS